MDELTREFLIESQEGLDRMERCLTDLEERPQDTELLGEIFRSVHTIKGTTGFLGFKRLEKLAHTGENLLGLLRDGKLSANQAIITGLLQLMDALRGVLKIIESHNQEGEGTEAEAQQDAHLIARLNELQQPKAVAVTVDAKAASSGSVAIESSLPAHLAPVPSASSRQFPIQIRPLRRRPKLRWPRRSRRKRRRTTPLSPKPPLLPIQRCAWM